MFGMNELTTNALIATALKIAKLRQRKRKTRILFIFIGIADSSMDRSSDLPTDPMTWKAKKIELVMSQFVM